MTNNIYLKFQYFPVFCVIFSDFSSPFKIPWLFPDWKMPSHFSRFSSPSGNLDKYCGKKYQNVTLMNHYIANMIESIGKNSNLFTLYRFHIMLYYLLDL